MSTLEIEAAAAVSPPSRAALSAWLFADEERLVEELIARSRLNALEEREVEKIARGLVNAARSGRRQHGGVDAFLHEYGLLTEEGVLLLCLAEALLRIPDEATADRLIAGTLPAGDWAKHLGHSSSLYVNA